MGSIYRSKKGTLGYYGVLITAFQRAGPSPVVDELTRMVSELECLADGGWKKFKHPMGELSSPLARGMPYAKQA